MTTWQHRGNLEGRRDARVAIVGNVGVCELTIWREEVFIKHRYFQLILVDVMHIELQLCRTITAAHNNGYIRGLAQQLTYCVVPLWVEGEGYSGCGLLLLPTQCQDTEWITLAVGVLGQ